INLSVTDTFRKWSRIALSFFIEVFMPTEKRPLASTPPMGWNSWNMYGSRVDEDAIRKTADAIVSMGFKDVGYEYVVIDDCWSEKGKRDQDGNLIPHAEKFPNGMNALCDYVHGKGLM